MRHTRLELVRLGKPGKVLPGLAKPSLGSGHVCLHDLLAGTRANVRHVDRERDRTTLQSGTGPAQPEVGIREAEAKGIERTLANGVEVAIAHIHTLAVVGVVEVTHLDVGAVVLPAGPCGGELAGGVGPTQEHVGEGIAHHRSQLREHEDVTHLGDGTQVDGTTRVEDEHEALIARVEGQDVTNLGGGEQDIACDRLAIIALARHAGEHVDGSVSGKVQGDVVVRLGHHGAHGIEDQHLARRLGLPLEPLAEVLLGLGAASVVRVKPSRACESEARVDEALFDAHNHMGVDVARSRASLHAIAHAVAKGGKRGSLFERERPVGAQQHHALRKPLPHASQMVLLVVEQLHGRPLPHASFQHDPSIIGSGIPLPHVTTFLATYR